MNNESIAHKIDNLGLCVGCGLCVSLDESKESKMVFGEDGFLHPKMSLVDQKVEEEIKAVCPGINLIGKGEDSHFKKLWGEHLLVEEGFSTIGKVRKVASSGGCITTLGIYVLEHEIVDAVLHVGADQDDFRKNILKVSRDRESLMEYSSSRYAPARVFDNLLEILKNSDDSFCFIGKPCDIATLQRLLKSRPQYSDRIKCTIAIFCAGIPSISATDRIIDSFDPELPIRDLIYRGNGWPGYFSFKDNSGKTYQMTYNDSWGKVLGRDVNFRCKLCPDGIGLTADFAIGDSWETKDGFPDFEEKEGKSLIVCRTENAKNILLASKDAGYINSDSTPIGRMKAIQPLQYRRRSYYPVRVFAFFLLTRQLASNLKLSSIKNIPIKPIELLREFYGTLKRVKSLINKKS